MANDIQRINVNKSIQNGRPVFNQAGAVASGALVGRAINTPITDIEAKYDDKLDESRYYQGDTPF
jgi:hypothetical protein